MRRLVIMLVLAAAGVAVLGFYLGWFRIESDSTSDTAHVKLSVDKDKIHEDKKKAQDKVQDLAHKGADK
jgi:hypothetical protein